MKLQELLKDVAVKNSTAAQAIEIKEVRYDSRAVQPGDLFVAIRGYATDGHKYIAKAMEQGAAAVVCEEAPEGVPAVVVENSRIALAEIAANRFGHPAESMVMLGVTGTNGKTTTTYLVKHMLEDAGHKVGLIGTNQNLIGDEVIETERTTPESYELHALFARMRDAGCTHVIMEVSSHSLVLDRVHGIPFAVGAFTNLTQDHLDFHKTMEEYRKAKALLLRQAGGRSRSDRPAAARGRRGVHRTVSGRKGRRQAADSGSFLGRECTDRARHRAAARHAACGCGEVHGNCDRRQGPC